MSFGRSEATHGNAQRQQRRRSEIERAGCVADFGTQVLSASAAGESVRAELTGRDAHR